MFGSNKMFSCACWSNIRQTGTKEHKPNNLPDKIVKGKGPYVVVFQEQFLD